MLIISIIIKFFYLLMFKLTKEIFKYLKYILYTVDIKSNNMYSCQVQDIMKLLGKKWSLLIIKCISKNKEISFTGLKKELKISQKVLWERLEELEKEDLIRNFTCTKNSNKLDYRSIYSLTQKGIQIEKFLELFEHVEEELN